MKKTLNGAELADYIKERQARQVRNLRQEYTIVPRLAIVATEPTPVIAAYMRLKARYGADILVEVESIEVTMATIIDTIERLNHDQSVHGIIVQLPLSDPNQTDAIVSRIAREKDVDGLGSDELFVPATALAIEWLLSGYNVEIRNKNLVIVGNGRLVGAPLAKLWRHAGLDVTVIDIDTPDADAQIAAADVIVTATGAPGRITSALVKPGAVVVDAGTASEDGKIVGDVAAAVRQRDDITMTPEKGGVGPLTVAALFDNVIQAARRSHEI